MKYHYVKPSIYTSKYGKTYHCNHPIYNTCTLYTIGDKGLAIIQQRCKDKMTYWSDIDPWLVDQLYTHKSFKKFFDERADKPKNGLYPTVTIRQIMWALKIKPIKREKWETYFDRKNI